MISVPGGRLAGLPLIFDNSTAFQWSHTPPGTRRRLNGQQEPYLPRHSNPLHTADSSFAELPRLLSHTRGRLTPRYVWATIVTHKEGGKSPPRGQRRQAQVSILCTAMQRGFNTAV